MPGIARVLINGFTYSYINKKSKNGEKCCRPVKSKCQPDETTIFTGKIVCKITRGEIKCGKGCTRIIKALEKLERREKKKKRGEKKKKRGDKKEKIKKEKKKENKIKNEKTKKEKIKKRKEKKHHKSVPHKKSRSGLFRSGPVNRNHQEQVTPNYEGKTVEEYSHEDKPCPYEEYGNHEIDEEKDGYGGEGRKGLKVKEGQKLTHKQLQMLETVAEEKQREPTNPLCKDPNQLFRSLFD